MRILLVTALLLSHWANAVSLSQCRCTPVSADDVTRGGANVELKSTEEKTLKSVQGIAEAIGPPLEGVLVEIYTIKGFKRIAACQTGADGKFCFKNIPAGEYELIGSIGPGWNTTHIFIKVNPKNRRSSRKKLHLGMLVGG